MRAQVTFMAARPDVVLSGTEFKGEADEREPGSRRQFEQDLHRRMLFRRPGRHILGQDRIAVRTVAIRFSCVAPSLACIDMP